MMASSTARTSLLTRVRRALLMSVRRIIWRAAFFADDVLAMERSLLLVKGAVRRLGKGKTEAAGCEKLIGPDFCPGVLDARYSGRPFAGQLIRSL
ncbi:hypothetical protein HYPGJ_10542 [Hyphomicrobium sp. GJ21]|nr:hypothetical protein HYPGJ_10542 [Hyphomicrobium sp. GJ21]